MLLTGRASWELELCNSAGVCMFLRTVGRRRCQTSYHVHEAKHTESLEGEREQCPLVVGESDVLAIARFGVDVSHREQRSRKGDGGG